MMSELKADTLIQLNKSQRKRQLLERAKLIDASHITDEEEQTQKSLRTIYQRSTVLNPILKPYLERRIQKFNEQAAIGKAKSPTEAVEERIQAIKKEFVELLESLANEGKASVPTQQSLFTIAPDDLPNEEVAEIIEAEVDATNLFTLFGTELLAISNSVTRTLCTKMGNFFEVAATCSPYALNPEKEFGFKITGIDLIILVDGEVEFVQLKTKKDTLTGSQSPRANKELSLHTKYAKSSFAAAFDAGKGWTFKSDVIPTYAGEAFWSRIHIDFKAMESQLREAYEEIEKAYLKLIRQKFLK